MSLNSSQKPKANNPKEQPEWYQPLIPGIEEFIAQLNQNSQPHTTSQSK